jgi:aspartate racemase
MKKAGIIGGMGPASTLDYYNDIINGCRERTMSDQYPELVIDSVNMTQMLGYIADNNMDELINMLYQSIIHLKSAGADFAAMASNTPHVVFNRLQEKSPIPLISIIEETCSYAKSIGCKSVVVLGTMFTMRSGLYTDAFDRYGIKAYVPDSEGQDVVHNIIFPNLENAVIIAEEKERMLELADKLVRKHSADALVLGCTELPLMIKPQDLSTTILNTTQIHVNAIIKEMIK